MWCVAISSASVSALDHLDHLRNHQQFAAIHAVRDDAADQREQKDRNVAEKCVEPEQERRIRDFENEPVLRDLLHPRADARRAGAKPQQPEVAVLKCFESAAEQADGLLRKRFLALDQMEQIPVAVVEEYQAIPLSCSSVRRENGRLVVLRFSCAASKSSLAMARCRMPGILFSPSSAAAANLRSE